MISFCIVVTCTSSPVTGGVATDSTHSDSTRPNIIIPMLCNRCRERGIFNVGQSLPSSLSLSTSHTVCGHIPYHTFLITHSIIYGRNNYPSVRGQLFPVPKINCNQTFEANTLQQVHKFGLQQFSGRFVYHFSS